MDAGLYLFHNGAELLERGCGPYFYVPKMQSHLEARLWADVFDHSLAELGLPPDAVAVTALIETLPAAFEMDEILYELRNHSPALNAGRWDYIFSMIKSFRQRPEFVLPERTAVTMTVPVHARLHRAAGEDLPPPRRPRDGGHGRVPARAAPTRRQNAAAMEKIAADKGREAGDGFDGTWVAHPDFVGAAMEQFDAVLGDRPNQVERQRDDVDVSAADLLDAASAGAVDHRGRAAQQRERRASSTSPRGCAATGPRRSTA